MASFFDGVGQLLGGFLDEGPRIVQRRQQADELASAQAARSEGLVLERRRNEIADLANSIRLSEQGISEVDTIPVGPDGQAPFNFRFDPNPDIEGDERFFAKTGPSQAELRTQTSGTVKADPRLVGKLIGELNRRFSEGEEVPAIVADLSEREPAGVADTGFRSFVSSMFGQEGAERRSVRSTVAADTRADEGRSFAVERDAAARFSAIEQRAEKLKQDILEGNIRRIDIKIGDRRFTRVSDLRDFIQGRRPGVDPADNPSGQFDIRGTRAEEELMRELQRMVAGPSVDIEELRTQAEAFRRRGQ